MKTQDQLPSTNAIIPEPGTADSRAKDIRDYVDKTIEFEGDFPVTWAVFVFRDEGTKVVPHLCTEDQALFYKMLIPSILYEKKAVELYLAICPEDRAYGKWELPVVVQFLPHGVRAWVRNLKCLWVKGGISEKDCPALGYILHYFEKVH